MAENKGIQWKEKFEWKQIWLPRRNTLKVERNFHESAEITDTPVKKL